MKLEQQVTNLKLSKKLKELGYPQEGLWCYVFKPNGEEPFLAMHGGHKDWQKADVKKGLEPYKLIVAPTVVELGEWLKDSKVLGQKVSFGWIPSLWICQIPNLSPPFAEETEANARAKMLIWLVENDYLKFDNE